MPTIDFESLIGDGTLEPGVPLTIGVDHGREGGDHTAICDMKHTSDGWGSRVVVYSNPTGVSHFYNLFAQQFGDTAHFSRISDPRKRPWVWRPQPRGFPLQRLRGARGRKRALLQRRAVEGRY